MFFAVSPPSGTLTSICLAMCSKCFPWSCLTFSNNGLGTIFIPTFQVTTLTLTWSRARSKNGWDEDLNSGLPGFRAFSFYSYVLCKVPVELKPLSWWGDSLQVFHFQLVLCHCLAVKQAVVPVTGALGVVWGPHDSEGWAGRFFRAQESLWVWRFD